MNYSPEALIAFIEAAALGSFSAAARKLRKSQSTISTAIANLEVDLGLILFDRQKRNPVLTTHGRRILAHVQEILAASERLNSLSIRLADQVETHLSFVISDTYHPTHHEGLMYHFAARYPDIELECLIAEGKDVIDLLQENRAHIGMVEVQNDYPAEIATARLPEQTAMAIFVSREHSLASEHEVLPEQLATIRQLYLNTYNRIERNQLQGPGWSAPNYMMLLELAAMGFGWTILPPWMVEEYGHNKLVKLHVKGWPKMISVDVVWSKKKPPGPAGYWLLDRLIGGTAAHL